MGMGHAAGLAMIRESALRLRLLCCRVAPPNVPFECTTHHPSWSWRRIFLIKWATVLQLWSGTGSRPHWIPPQKTEPASPLAAELMTVKILTIERNPYNTITSV